MAEAMRSRFAIDLDQIERQLNQSAQQPAASQKDPLAELARIVGQDDPFRVLLAAEPPERRPAREPAGGRASPAGYEESWEPAYEPEPEAYLAPQTHPAPYQGYTLRSSAPAEDMAHGYGLADSPMHSDADASAGPPHVDGDGAAYGDYMPVDPGYGQRPHDHDPAAYPQDERLAAPPRSRKGLMAVGAALGVAVLGIGGTMALRGHGPGQKAGGEPPVVTADASPTKVAPQNPGGVEIPDQNKQIYERGGQDGQTKIVSREEQPIDVRQATRVASAGADGPLPSNVVPSVNPPPPQYGSINAALGEPRRVRTVSVGPDGTLKTPEQGAGRPAAGSAATPPQPAPTTGSAPSSTPALPPQRPRDMTSTTPQAAPPKPVASEPIAASSATPDASRPAKAPQRIAAAPQVPAAEPTETGNTPAAASGGYAVQLAVRPSEKEAKVAFQQLQQRHAGELAGKSPAIRRAEVNGGTVYRVRVGPMPRDEASSLCSRLQSSGGQCFVAKN